MPVVQNIVTRPGGAVAAGVRVRVRLIASDPPGGPGFATDRTILGEWFTLTDAAGAWSLTLTANASVTPAATVYEVAELAGPNAATYFVSVPSGAGPYWAGAILTTAPTALQTVTIATVVERVTPVSIANASYVDPLGPFTALAAGDGPSGRAPDTYGLWTPGASVIQTTQPGWYQASGMIEFAPNATGVRILYVTTGSAGYDGDGAGPASSTVSVRVGASMLFYCSGPETFYLGGFQNSGAPLNVNYLFLSVARIGP